MSRFAHSQNRCTHFTISTMSWTRKPFLSISIDSFNGILFFCPWKSRKTTATATAICSGHIKIHFAYVLFANCLNTLFSSTSILLYSVSVLIFTEALELKILIWILFFFSSRYRLVRCRKRISISIVPLNVEIPFCFRVTRGAVCW